MSKRAKSESLDPNDAADAVSFEELVRGLEDAVRKLEGGELPLDESLAVFEEGVRLARAGATRLDEVERRVELLLSGEGAPRTRPLHDG
ncbi:MAG: exodeoxyribonuclease VII small subunit [Sandaracinus sp.]|nr:exodeoxyribonuclease VII small subunit [Myxococcales bacterium]MCB9632660.1 exodeoxyribonuclease VII small subunit [Sandaracinus sp.]